VSSGWGALVSVGGMGAKSMTGMRGESAKNTREWEGERERKREGIKT
jgi:hypothetical protein